MPTVVLSDLESSVGTGVCSLIDWSMVRTAPGEVSAPPQLERPSSSWLSASAPGTVAQALQSAGIWNIDAHEDFDASDWWYRCRFDAPDVHRRARLRFLGLATLADVWLNDRFVLAADNMFREYSVNV